MKRIFKKYFWDGIVQKWTLVATVEVILQGILQIYDFNTNWHFIGWLIFLIILVILQIIQNRKNGK